MSKKDIEEKRILEIIYNPNEYKNEKSERPDFIVEKPPNGVKFGVEITRLFKNGANARFLDNPKYAIDINRGKYWNKGDEHHLFSDVFTLEDIDGSTSFQFPGVMATSPTLEEYKEIIKSRIIDKNEKVKAYNESLTYTNLIIFDNEKTFCDLPNGVVLNEILNDLIDQIHTTQFNEIFIVSIGNKANVIYYLKADCLFNEMMKLKKYITFDLNYKQCKDEFSYIFYKLLKNLGYSNLKIIQSPKGLGVVVNDYVFISGYEQPIVSYCDIKNECTIVEDNLAKCLDINMDDYFNKTNHLKTAIKLKI